MSQPPATGVLSFTPVADQFGTAMITVTAENGGPDNNLETPGNNATFTQTFTVYVTQAGAPTLDPLSDLTIDENALSRRSISPESPQVVTQTRSS